jgi:5'-deoxynucleotidase YfbR-like HD superfamily hydrolase
MISAEELLTGKARLVAHVTRFAGTPLHRTETVAEHSYMTAQYALFIGWHCISLGGSVDLGKLLSRALVHDLDEAVMVDLPRPIKYADPELLERWKAMCTGVVRGLGDTLGVPFNKEWSEAKDDSLEGHILILADLMTVTAYVIEELRFGNTYMIDVLVGNIGYLEKFLAGALTPHPPANELKDLARDALIIARAYLLGPAYASRR